MTRAVEHRVEGAPQRKEASRRPSPATTLGEPREGVAGAQGVMLGLQRSAGNAAVAALVSARRRPQPGAVALRAADVRADPRTVEPAAASLDRVHTVAVEDPPVAQRDVWGRITGAARAVKGAAGSVAQWAMEHVVRPLQQMGGAAASKVGAFASKMGTALATVRPRWSDLLMIHLLGFRAVGAMRRAAMDDAIAVERRQRQAAARSRGEPVGEVGPGPVEQLEGAVREMENLADGALGVSDEIVEGAILGDFKTNPTGWNTVGQIALGFVPYAGQVADLRDTVAAIGKLHKSGWKDPWEWVNLGLTLVAWVPGVGDIVKGLGKGAVRMLRGSGAKILKLGRKLWSGARRLAPKIWGGAKAFGRSLVNGARRLGQRMLTKGRDLGRRALQAGRRLWDRASSLASRARKGISELGQRLRGAGSAVLDKARGLFSRAVSAVRGVARGALDRVGGAVRRGIDAAKRAAGVVRGITNEITRRAQSGLAAARRWASGTLNAIRTRVTGALQRARAAASAAWNRALVAGRSLVSRARARVTKLVTQDIPGLGRRVKEFVTQNVRRLRDRIADGISRRWEALKTRLRKKRTQQELDDLARDPAKGSTRPADRAKGIRERDAGLELERRGDLPGPIRRDPTGAAEFIDGKGQAWDIKAFNSNFPPRKGGFSVNDARTKMQAEFAKGEKVILDTNDLSPAHLAELRKLVSDMGWERNVRWWP